MSSTEKSTVIRVNDRDFDLAQAFPLRGKDFRILKEKFGVSFARINKANEDDDPLEIMYALATVALQRMDAGVTREQVEELVPTEVIGPVQAALMAEQEPIDPNG